MDIVSSGAWKSSVRVTQSMVRGNLETYEKIKRSRVQIFE